MPRYEPFPPGEAERFGRLAAALRAYLEHVLKEAGSDAAYTAFRLHSADDGIDAFVVLAPHDNDANAQLIAAIERLCMSYIYAIDGAPIAAQHYGARSLR